MRINLLIALSLTIIIGIALIPILGSLSEDAFENVTETVNVEKVLDGADNLPITIKTGDTVVIELPEFLNNVVYTETLRPALTDPSTWGFSCTGESIKVLYNATNYELIGGTWDAPVFGAEYSDTWIDWSVDGTTGTLTFLQDFPYDLVGIERSNNLGVINNTFINSTSIADLSVYNTTEEVPVYGTADYLVNLIPLFGVLLIVGTVIVYIKFKKE